VWTESPKATQQMAVVYNMSLTVGTGGKTVTTSFQKSSRNNLTNHRLASLTSFQKKLLEVIHYNKAGAADEILG